MEGANVYIRQNIVIQWLCWHFFDVPKGILKAWRNFLFFNFNYFSVVLLLKTFFSPWRRYSWSYGRGFNIQRYIEVFLSNLLSRALGAIVRSFLIVFGLITEIFIISLGLIVFLGWLILPALLIFGLAFGIKVMF
ncbi:MAG: hypothetical protein A2Z68_00475 [Candidatus Nealsonbacteria bacterium RBG_13_38_11]|uniref:Uncharacterized protein n=1 Tax=Candidatus Nealsonbacteria bacterium RBG_13_38_11 TaxID=1801662 RepID=A0A1G2DZ89_9BACT|nr:MAG: hypothetical protein A2Z68_00475 [Candidatus Nealsonbacteria bacterium RBG_13_38_11]HXK32344.1 hypothetical protein [Candidatus Paceibacterota bacterium]